VGTAPRKPCFAARFRIEEDRAGMSRSLSDR
jgi:hypothetical protein